MNKNLNQYILFILSADGNYINQYYIQIVHGVHYCISSLTRAVSRALLLDLNYTKIKL